MFYSSEQCEALFGDHIFPYGDWKKNFPVGACRKKLISDPVNWYWFEWLQGNLQCKYNETKHL